jgi:NADPH-dependent curcumin reductase CurA
MTQNLKILLRARPTGQPTPDIFQVASGLIPDPGEGEVLLRSIYLSLDPAMRGWMNEGKSYIAPVELGAVMRGMVLAEVVTSRDPRFVAGDVVEGTLGWQQYGVLPGKSLQKVPPGLPLPTILGVLGATGLTAYFGLLDVGQPKAGQTVVVSGAAGAVGSVVGQIAKLLGCRVVGIAGSAEKCRWLHEDLGFDVALDYKTTPDLAKALRAACPSGIDVYFDNVGGDILDAALRNLARGARVVICGAISQYNAGSALKGPSNYLSLLVNRARMEGFVVFDYAARYGEARTQLAAWLAEGKLQHREEIVDGLENAPAALLRLFDGSNTGKLMVRVGPEPSAALS